MAEGSISIANGGRLSLSVLVQLLISVLILWQDAKSPILVQEKKGNPLILFLMWTPICLGLCMISQAAITGISMAMKIPSTSGFVFPSSASEWAIYFLNLTVGVAYEESIYRVFLPDSLLLFTEKKQKLRFPCEIVCVLIFAFSHRYLGPLAVVNAALCGMVLRIGKVKSGRVFAPALSHLIYNILQTIILYLLAKP